MLADLAKRARGPPFFVSLGLVACPVIGGVCMHGGSTRTPCRGRATGTIAVRPLSPRSRSS